MKVWESEHLFKHSWASVTAANWCKYPNPFNPAVVSTDVVDRKVNAEGNLVTHRIIKTHFNMPAWLQSIIGEAAVYVSEVSEIDPRTQTLTMRSRNMTFENILSIEEQLKYTASSSESTKLNQEARITVPGVGSGFLESKVVRTVEANADKGRMALEHVIKRIADGDLRLGVPPAATAAQ